MQESVPASEVLERLTRQASARDALEFAPVENDEARDKAIDAIISELLEDPEAAFQPVAALYQDFQVRCRIARLSGRPLDLASFRQRVALARAGVAETDVDPETWATAEAVAASPAGGNAGCLSADRPCCPAGRAMPVGSGDRNGLRDAFARARALVADPYGGTGFPGLRK